MPVHKVTKQGKIGYQWGTSGKVYWGYAGKVKAAAQGKAIYASGYKKK